MFIVRKDTTEMIEHEGKFYSPEDLAEKLKVKGEMEVVKDEENWFSRTIAELAEQENKQ